MIIFNSKSISTFLMLLTFVSCSKSATVDAPSYFTIKGKAIFQATAGSTLDTPLTVFVADSALKPVVGANVIWNVLSGGGTLSEISTTSDATGR